MIIYGTSGGGRRWGERERMEVGATVHPMHSLIRMPISNKMLALISVQEATKPKLFEGMDAIVTVDALPDEVFSGKLTKIAVLPDSTQAWLNPDLKVYKCEVELNEEQNKKMRPDMNCEVNMVVEEHENAIAVPIQCVVYVDGVPTVYVARDDEFKKRTVETGLDNNIVVHILSGLEDGEQVLLNPPLDEAAASNAIEMPSLSEETAAE